MILIYTTCKDTDEAVRLGTLLLKEKLAVCVNLWPIQSIYHGDDGQLNNSLEAGMLIKTLEPKIAAIEVLIEKHHSYSVPYLGVIEVKRSNRAYREWMTSIIE